MVRPYVTAALIGPVRPLLTCGLLVPLRHSVHNTDAALVLVVVIVAVAALGHRLAGLLAALSAGVWFDVFLTKPNEHFRIRDQTDIETTVLLFVVRAAVTDQLSQPTAGSLPTLIQRLAAVSLADQAGRHLANMTREAAPARHPPRSHGPPAIRLGNEALDYGNRDEPHG
jgi:K+-sensing histidine kinase KdpD